MNRTKFTISLIAFSFSAIFSGSEESYAQNSDEKRIFNTAHKVKIEATLVAGYGFDKRILGENPYNNETLIIRFGGGIGPAVSAGYYFSNRFELDLTFIYQNEFLEGGNENIFASDKIKGSFNRAIYLLTPKINFPVSRKGQLKFGAGLGFYGPGKFTYERSHTTFLIVIPLWEEGVKYVYKYKGNLGYHFIGEFEFFITELLSVSIGMKYYDTSYKLESIQFDDTSLMISKEVMDFIGKVRGNGFDYAFSAAIYF
jgi:hypothetical protein